MLPPPSSIFFPSTTLFRSRASFLLACRDGALRTAFPYRNVRLARDPREAPMSPDSRADVIENRSEANPVRPELQYLSGFGNELQSEAISGVLPEGQNSPQRPPRGLYTEQLSGTPFTAPRAENRRSWLYRIRPSAMHRAFRRIDDRLLRTAPVSEADPSPNRLRWNPLPFPDEPADFVDSLTTIGINGDAGARNGIGIHVYRATRPME